MRDHQQSGWLKFLEAQNHTRLLLFSYIYTLFVGYISDILGYEISLTIFYLPPIYIVSYFVGRTRALWLALFAGAMWMAADIGSGHVYSSAYLPYWNAGTRLVLFVVVALLFAALRASFEHEKLLARRDFLTGASNARAFYEMAEMEITRLRRYRHPFTIVHLDVDNFKTVNDTRGHQAGDDLLCLIVQTVRASLRDIDIVARLGGDEFALLLPETGAEAAPIVVQKIKAHLMSEMCRGAWPVSFSIGVLVCQEAPESMDKMLKLADDLTYEAKRAGKNTVKYGVVPVPQN